MLPEVRSAWISYVRASKGRKAVPVQMLGAPSVRFPRGVAMGTHLVAYCDTHLLFCSSEGQTSRVDLIGLKSRGLLFSGGSGTECFLVFSGF